MLEHLADRFDSSLPLHKAAWRSWSAMKTWVKCWLWYLNALYWAGVAFLPRPEAAAALVSYLAVGPLIVWTFVRHRGLTRAAGLIHLPWAPFAVYLGIRLFSSLLGAPVRCAMDPIFGVWLHLIFWSTTLCLLFDAWDLLRWLRGETFVLGSPAAAAAGASRLARQD